MLFFVILLGLIIKILEIYLTILGESLTFICFRIHIFNVNVEKFNENSSNEK